MSNRSRWLVDGAYTSATGWQTIISPNTFPAPQNEVNSAINSTSQNVELLNKGRARISYDEKYVKGNVSFSISVLRTNEVRTFDYGTIDEEMTYKEIFEEIIKSGISVRIRKQQYEGSWTTKETFAGYFKGLSKTYKMLGRPQRFVCDLEMERYNVDGNEAENY